LPYSFVWFDDAGATVLWATTVVRLDGFTPALALVCAWTVVLAGAET